MSVSRNDLDRFTSLPASDRDIFRCVAAEAPALTEAASFRLGLLLAPTVER